ncbi:MAG: hypothetical protein AAF614_14880 [Chloroflexota bacterium]
MRRLCVIGMIFALFSSAAPVGAVTECDLTDGPPMMPIVGDDFPACPDLIDVVDFNGDGFEDVVWIYAGEPLPSGGTGDRVFTILYGQAGTLEGADTQIITRGQVSGLLNDSYTNFGYRYTTADFNGDGFTDLVITAPWTDLTNESGAGVIYVLYGSVLGLVANNPQIIHQGTLINNNHIESGDLFGQAVVAGNFNGDEYADLAVGAQHEDTEILDLVIDSLGAVNVIYGSANGLRMDNDMMITLFHPEINADFHDNARFGGALEAGDFNGDGFDELAVGTPGYGMPAEVGHPAQQQGMVMVFRGTMAGLTLDDEELWMQGLNGLQGNAESGDRFGNNLAVGDFDNNGVDDLVVAATDEAVFYLGQDIQDAGAIHIIYGYQITDGLSPVGDQLWHRGQAGIEGVPLDEMRWGERINVGDFNGDDEDDLVVGTGTYDYDDGPDLLPSGAQVFYSNGNILSQVLEEMWTVDDLPAAAQDGFLGSNVDNVGDFNGDGFDDLAAANLLGVQLVYGTNTGLDTTMSHHCSSFLNTLECPVSRR